MKRAESPKYGRGLSALPHVVAERCTHGTAVADPCARCERETPRAKRHRKPAEVSA